MSDIRININFSNDTAHRSVTQKQKVKNKKFRKRRQDLQQQRYLGSKHNPHRGQSNYDQTPLHNGAPTKHPTSTPNKNLPYSGTTTCASHYSYAVAPLTSTYTLPSSTGRHEKPKDYGKSKAASNTSTFRVNQCLPQPGSSASASHCSSMTSTSIHTLASWTCTVNSAGNNDKPKKPVNPKSATTTTPGFSVPSSHKPSTTSGFSTPSSHIPTVTSSAVPTKYLAIDCEMVGTGPKGHNSQLARCSIVSYNGNVVYDKFINPTMPVTDYRTRWSGICRSDLVNATPYSKARKEILRLLNGKVVIGHAIHNDFKVLCYSHPDDLTRDTSRIPLLNQKAGFAENECASLKRLTKAIFNRDIQTGKKGHSSVEDARASMELYKVVAEEWEKRLTSKSQTSQ